MDLEALQTGYRELMHRLYSPEHCYRRLRTFLRDYRPPRIHGHHFRRVCEAHIS